MTTITALWLLSILVAFVQSSRVIRQLIWIKSYLRLLSLKGDQK